MALNGIYRTPNCRLGSPETLRKQAWRCRDGLRERGQGHGSGDVAAPSRIEVPIESDMLPALDEEISLSGQQRANEVGVDTSPPADAPPSDALTSPSPQSERAQALLRALAYAAVAGAYVYLKEGGGIERLSLVRVALAAAGMWVLLWNVKTVARAVSRSKRA